ncbi:MAG: amino acid permease [Actinomycetota bacterium]
MSSGTKARVVKLSVFALAMINVAAIVSARNLPIMAIYGWSMIALFAFSILVFLIPISMAAAELGTAWPRDGGIYAWVKQAFGGRLGFLAVWCDYSENLVWFPTVLAFIASSLAYVFDPALASNKLFLVATMLAFFWTATIVNLFGVRTSSAVGTVGTLIGSILPGVLVVILAAILLGGGTPSAIPFSAEALVPDLNIHNLAFLGGIILLFTGMEMAGFHSREMRDPGRDIPRAFLLGVVIIITFSVVASLAVALVLPAKQISLVSGTMEMFRKVFDQLNVGWLVKPVALLVTIGGLAHITPWILGPAKGVGAVARSGYAPPRLGRTNRRDVPVSLVIIQGIGGSLFALLFLFIPSVSTSYWMLSAITAQVVVLMYGLMFASVIRLRYTQPGTPRPYRIPGGKLGVWLVAGIGIAGCATSLYLGFVPPSQLKTGNPLTYVLILAAGVILLSAPPFIFALFQKASWKAEGAEEEAELDTEVPPADPVAAS